MRHKIKDKKFNRDSNHRKALLRNLVRSVVEHGSITTTVPKAKETKRQIDRLFAKALVDSVSNRRLIHSFFGKRDVVNTIFDKIMPVMGDRKSGFTRITQAGVRRGDNVQMVTLSLVSMPESIGTLKRLVEPKTKEVKSDSPKVKKTEKKEKNSEEKKSEKVTKKKSSQNDTKVKNKK